MKGAAAEAISDQAARTPRRAVTVRNVDIATQFEDTADALEIQNANPFRVRAYRNAARMLRAHGSEMAELVAQDAKLTELPGIGEDLAARITEIVKTGKSSALQKIQKKVPRFAMELLKLPGIGPRRARTLCEDADIHSLEQLHRAALDHRLRSLPGLGQKVEETILGALQKTKATAGRMKIATAASYADALVAHMQKLSGVSHVTVAGSFRRGRETVGDLDLLATAADGKRAIDHFVAFDQLREVLAAGGTRATAILKSGLQVDLRVVPQESYGAALHYFTGSKAHNIATRRIAQQKGLKLSEYGAFRGKKMVAGATEEEIYRAVGLPFIPPELREDRGEIDAARRGELPKLVELSDLKGDLHVHSDETDGHNTILEMAEAAKEMGLSYIAITDHSRRLKMVHGLDPKRLHAQMNAIDKLNARAAGATILKGIEVEILEDGALDLPDDVLARLDIVVGAVHSKFNLSRAEQTQRILHAMDNKHLHILAHPTGRLMQEREPYDVDMTRIISEAARIGCFLELNAHPDRLDLTDVYCRQAKDGGVLISIGSDAHRTSDLRNLRFGISQARRGWLEKGDILNTRPLGELQRLLKKRR